MCKIIIDTVLLKLIVPAMIHLAHVFISIFLIHIICVYSLLKRKELLDSYREPTKAHKTYQGVPNMSYAFTGRYMFSFSGLMR